MILKRWLPLALVALLVVVLVGCNFANAKGIDSIYVSYRDEVGRVFYEQKLDLKEQKLWKYSSSSYESNRIAASNPLAENEDFVFVCDLEENGIESFRREAERFGFAGWKEQYINPEICDGDQWDITILFSDGATKTIIGRNAYPSTWDKMYKAFEKLAGERILLFKSDHYRY